MREIDDISDAFWECVLYSGESAVGFSFIFSFGATLNNFFEETTPLFFVFFARRGCSLISLSLLSFFSLLLWGFIVIARTHTHTRARKKEVILEALSSSSSSSSSPLPPPAWCEKRDKR